MEIVIIPFPTCIKLKLDFISSVPIKGTLFGFRVVCYNRMFQLYLESWVFRTYY